MRLLSTYSCLVVLTTTSLVTCFVPSAISRTRIPSPSIAATRDATEHTIAASIAKGERRARERSAGQRQLCPCCQRPPAICVCSVLEPNIKTQQTDILILQHPNEFRKRHVSTVPLIGLVLEDNVKTKVGYEFNKESLLDSLGIVENSDGSPKPLLLFPGKDASDLEEYVLEQQENKIDPAVSAQSHRNLLILIDGTWAEAKRMARNSPMLLERCQMVQFAVDEDNDDTNQQRAQHQSVYHQIRREPEAHTISTLEAVAKALDIVEPPGGSLSSSLKRVLERHVERSLHNSVTKRAPRFSRDTNARTIERNKRTLEIQQDLFSEKESNNDDATTTLQDGAVLRPLSLADAPQINDWWDHKSSTSLTTVARCVIADRSADYGVCLGIYGPDDGKLRACIIRYEGSAIGMLHVDEPYRRQGYGVTLLRQATAPIEAAGDECIALIMEGNVASEKTFEKVGWERQDPTVKGTGKRKTNKKWIKKRSALIGG